MILHRHDQPTRPGDAAGRRRRLHAPALAGVDEEPDERLITRAQRELLQICRGVDPGFAELLADAARRAHDWLQRFCRR